ncbi:hypothetical protein KIPB_008838 [Kipferlia bialata]|uniref:Uncharacterized protein n=1 Tax=Kipferlia bialata TaxID=797122 RepID=A0A9K3D2Z1_9EUKA|nr:hypothetical protein KIPB_008838 [Kipferlia bialata]|eukprot:g8838.t1
MSLSSDSQQSCSSLSLSQRLPPYLYGRSLPPFTRFTHCRVKVLCTPASLRGRLVHSWNCQDSFFAQG